MNISRIYSFCFIVVILLPIFLLADDTVKVNMNNQDCVNNAGSISMGIDIKGDLININPTCVNSFKMEVLLEDKSECEIISGMCSGLFPKNKLIVSCTNGIFHETQINCPGQEKENKTELNAPIPINILPSPAETPAPVEPITIIPVPDEVKPIILEDIKTPETAEVKKEVIKVDPPKSRFRYAQKACEEGKPNLDLMIQVAGEDFTFSPLCNEKFEKQFKTTSNIACSINAGMCTDLDPSASIIYSCSNNDYVKADVPCKEILKLKPEVMPVPTAAPVVPANTPLNMTPTKIIPLPAIDNSSTQPTVTPVVPNNPTVQVSLNDVKKKSISSIII
ncbi:MAG: hypothetical protein ABIA04_08990 [Pseudomonadota bacterium]